MPISLFSDKLLDKIKMEEHINYLLSLQDNFGFSNDSSKKAQLNHTYYAIRALLILDSINNINKNKLLDFILSTENNSGGFGYQPGKASNLLSTKHALFLIKDIS